MKTRAVRLHGVMDLRLEEIELPEIKDGEITGRGSQESSRRCRGKSRYYRSRILR